MDDLEETILFKQIKDVVKIYPFSKQKTELDRKLETLTIQLGNITQNCGNCKLCKSKKEIPTTFEIVAMIRQAEANREITEKRAQELLRKVADSDKVELLKLYRGLTEIF